jgi:elongation factor P
MYSITELKKGTLIQLDGKPYRVIEYSQKVMGRGGSIVNVRLKGLMDGAVIPKTFKGSEKVEPADVQNRTVQYLYNDGSTFYFMDNNTFEQFELSVEDVAENADFMKDGMDVTLQFFDGRVINVELPNTMYLAVTYTENVVKGDTTSSVLKDATLETGKAIKVPSFIKEGDVLKVDTRSGEYLERKKD